jgi:hypothetical protein
MYKLNEQNRQGKTRLSKWYVPYDDDEKVCTDHPFLPYLTNTLSAIVSMYREADVQVRLRGEVHRLIAPRDQKYQSNFVEVSSYEPCASHELIISSEATRSFTDVMPVYSSAAVSILTIMNWHIWKLSTYLSRFSVCQLPKPPWKNMS